MSANFKKKASEIAKEIAAYNTLINEIRNLKAPLGKAEQKLLLSMQSRISKSLGSLENSVKQLKVATVSREKALSKRIANQTAEYMTIIKKTDGATSVRPAVVKGLEKLKKDRKSATARTVKKALLEQSTLLAKESKSNKKLKVAQKQLKDLAAKF